MTTLCITGIGGFIGRRLAERALARGFVVSGLEFDPSAAQRVRATGCRVVVGDIRDPNAAREATSGADVVVHTAAVVTEGGAMSHVVDVNVNGTTTMCEASVASGVGHFIHFSSVMVYGFDFPDGVAEDGPLVGHGNPYCESKIQSETVVASFGAQLGFTIVRPGDVYGPGSIPWIVRPLALADRNVLAVPSRSAIMNPLYVDNLVDALMLMVDRKAANRTYNVTDGEPTTFYDFMGRVAAWRRKQVRVLPPTVMKVLAGGATLVARITRRPPVASPSAIRFLQRPGHYSIERIRRELGYDPAVTLTDGLRETARWAEASLGSNRS
jgi:nucleoside-diphosphate-sugar epimerase